VNYLDALREHYRQADPEDRRHGAAWYFAARGELFDVAQRYRYPLKRVAYAAAALLEHVAAMCRAGRGRDARGHYGHCLRKAVAILERGEYRALSGPKVVPFARALYGEHDAAVVDRWVWRAAGGVGYLTARRTRDVQAALRRLAREVRRPVAIVQAIVWVVVRRAADPAQEPIPF